MQLRGRKTAPPQAGVTPYVSGRSGDPFAQGRIPLVVHILYRLDFGGLENGVVNLINGMAPSRYRHAIVCLTEATDFRNRLKRNDIPIYELHKRDGNDFGMYWRLWKLLRRLRPDVVHTRNLPTLDCQPVAWLAGVRSRVHGEHGWDVIDLTGKNSKYLLLRRLVQPFVQRYIPLSVHIADWLSKDVRVAWNKIRRICNGVDSGRFTPAQGTRGLLPVEGFAPPESIVVGTVGRMETVKDPLNLVDAFVRLHRMLPDNRKRDIRLVMVGDGRLHSEVRTRVRSAGIEPLVWLAGARNDTPELLRGLDIFVLPSIAEGISNTILEAMASGLPVVATAVGGNAELVEDGATGHLVRPSDPGALADALRRYVEDAGLRRRQGFLGRQRVECEFSMDGMIRRYVDVYDELLAERAPSLVGG